MKRVFFTVTLVPFLALVGLPDGLLAAEQGLPLPTPSSRAAASSRPPIPEAAASESETIRAPAGPGALLILGRILPVEEDAASHRVILQSHAPRH